MRIGYYEKFDKMLPILIDISSEDNVVPIVKPALEVKNHKIRTKYIIFYLVNTSIDSIFFHIVK